MRPRRCVPWLLIAWLFVVPAVADDAGAMTQEDVVRLFVGGTPVEQILAGIAEREPAFDLSPDMIEELRRIELPDELIEAMRRRQEEAVALQKTEELEALEIYQSALSVLINPGRDADSPYVLSIGTRVDPQLAAEWELSNAPGDRRFAGLALFLACDAGDHVPDQWRMRSPLGRDFLHVRRHRMLAFEATAASDDQPGEVSRLKLELPASIDVDLEKHTTHNLVIGLALQVGGRYFAAVMDRLEGVEVPDEGRVLRAKVRGRSQSSLKVRFLRDDEEDEAGSDD